MCCYNQGRAGVRVLIEGRLADNRLVVFSDNNGIINLEMVSKAIVKDGTDHRLQWLSCL